MAKIALPIAPANNNSAEEQEISPPRVDAAYAARHAAYLTRGFSVADLDGHLDAAGHVLEEQQR